MKLKTKLIASFLCVGLIPVIVVGVVAFNIAKQLEQGVSTQLRTVASDSLEKIERNLFERYGDVQAFGYNTVAHDKSHWYKPSDDNPLVQSMDKYIYAYGCYYLSVLVDLDGKVAAVNSRDSTGKPVETRFLYEKNFKDATWFQDALAGRFLESKQLTGTVVEDVAIDQDIRRIFNDEGLCIGFSAPVKNLAGETIGVWKNYTKMSLVEEIVAAAQADGEASQLIENEVTLIDRSGRVLVDCDPTLNGEPINRDVENVVLKLNLGTKGVAAADAALKGGTGSIRSLHARKGEWQSAGYAHSSGAMGYPGLGWSLLMRVPERVSLANVHAVEMWVGGILVGVLVIVTTFAWLIARKIVAPIADAVNRLEEISLGEGDLTKKLSKRQNDEVGQLADGFNMFVETLRNIIHDVKDSAAEVATLSTQIAASAEEMSAAVGEVARQTTQVATSAEHSGKLAEHGRSVVQQTVAGMDQINTTVTASVESVAQLGARGDQIGRVISVINDIADQTNLLALNAAIEAARAGEHGRGFAVVADEVRKLAERTTRATEEIGGSIAAIQTDTQNAVQQMNQGQAQVQRGVALAATAGESMTEIADGAGQVSSMIMAISAAAEEAGAGARESAEAAVKLSNKAEALTEKMAKFSTERRSRPRSNSDIWSEEERQRHLAAGGSKAPGNQNSKPAAPRSAR